MTQRCFCRVYNTHELHDGPTDLDLCQQMAPQRPNTLQGEYQSSLAFHASFIHNVFRVAGHFLASLMPCFCALQEYYTSGFLSVQGAIDSYVMGIGSSLETSLPMGMENITIVDSGAIIQRPSFWTEWGTVFPTAAYIHNEFYDGVGTTSQYRP